MKKPPKKILKKTSGQATGAPSWRELADISRHTLSDLRHMKELVTLATGAAIPGGFIAYTAYRIKKYRERLDYSSDE